ncbi:heavy-metal-associated domain-containing protein [Candidatus Methylocalor cossyra]|uniref:Heavy-metal-associated domain family protein n=1 Tax=Candidatus Methylocalor cossyra TaxID=3108543 RepID=A0ABM9NGR4_9GAMM
MATTVLQVAGMKCGGCENTVQEAVKACPGVTGVTASHQAGTVTVEYDEATANLDAVKQAIRERGFTVA